MAKRNRKSRVVITLDLTREQAHAVWGIVIGHAMCGPMDGVPKHLVDAWHKLADLLSEGEKEADARDAQLAARTKPCRWCGVPVVHSARGLGMAPNHDCPHGRSCGENGKFACPTCKREREAVSP